MTEPQAGSEPGSGRWVSQSEAGLQLGWKLNRVISARRAGRLQGRKNNRGEWLVLLPAGLQAGARPGFTPVGAGAVPGREPGSDTALAELIAKLREELAELRHGLGRAEGRAETLL